MRGTEKTKRRTMVEGLRARDARMLKLMANERELLAEFGGARLCGLEPGA